MCYDTYYYTTIVYSQVFDNYAVTVMIGGEPYTLGLFDTAGKTDIQKVNDIDIPIHTEL